MEEIHKFRNFLCIRKSYNQARKLSDQASVNSVEVLLLQVADPGFPLGGRQPRWGAPMSDADAFQ